MSLKNFAIAFFLILACAVSAWSIYLSTHGEKKIINATSNQPDAIMEDIVAVILNKEGKPILKVETPKLIHYAENDTTEMVTPHLTIFRQSPQPWYIDAIRGRASNGINEITFRDHVIIHHPGDRENPLTTMKTASLTLFPNQHIAQTNEAILVTQPDTKVSAIGMLANWNDGTVKLLSDAREEYAPSH